MVRLARQLPYALVRDTHVIHTQSVLFQLIVHAPHQTRVRMDTVVTQMVTAHHQSARLEVRVPLQLALRVLATPAPETPSPHANGLQRHVQRTAIAQLATDVAQGAHVLPLPLQRHVQRTTNVTLATDVAQGAHASTRALRTVIAQLATLAARGQVCHVLHRVLIQHRL